jgi:hypothetical protein
LSRRTLKNLSRTHRSPCRYHGFWSKCWALFLPYVHSRGFRTAQPHGGPHWTQNSLFLILSAYLALLYPQSEIGKWLFSFSSSVKTGMPRPLRFKSLVEGREKEMPLHFLLPITLSGVGGNWPGEVPDAACCWVSSRSRQVEHAERWYRGDI